MMEPEHMTEQEQINYDRIAESIRYLKENFKEQPSLNEIASKVHLSPFHFQRLFSDWAGVSPKKFTQYLSVEYAKQLLKGQQETLLDTAYKTGLSGTSRLHDLFVNIEGMTPGEYKMGGENLTIHFSFFKSPFGTLLAASTSKGICHISFEDENRHDLTTLKQQFPNAKYQQKVDKFQQDALLVFQNDWKNLDTINLHLKGSPFQLKVWEALLKIPMGGLTTYGKIAQTIQRPKASRAVGTAIGRNPVAYLIPCHRVIQSSGGLGGYRWGTTRKTAIIGWEASKVNG